MGWTVTLAYFASVVACLLAARKGASGTPVERWVWLSLAGALMAFGLNKQVDLQTPGLDQARELAVEQGWYAWRRVVQSLTILGALAGLFFLTRILLQRTPRSAFNLRIAVIGFFGLLASLGLPYLRFEPLSRVLHFSVLKAQPEVWQFQVRELMECGFVVLVGTQGLKRSSTRATS